MLLIFSSIGITTVSEKHHLGHFSLDIQHDTITLKTDYTIYTSITATVLDIKQVNSFTHYNLKYNSK